MTAPSIKEALKPCPFCNGEALLLHGGPGNWFVQCTQCKCTTNDVQRDRAVELWNTRATFQPDGERREAINERAIRALEELTAVVRGECPSLLNEDSGGDGELSVEIDEIIKEADAALSSGLVQDEAGIRADEREKCAEIADLRYEPVATEIAAAIRSARDGGES